MTNDLGDVNITSELNAVGKRLVQEHILRVSSKKQYIIADIVGEHDMFYIVKIGNTISTIMKTDNVVVHNYEEGEK